jgi:hypothetical protein
MAVKHHLDQPLMSVNEIDISPGFESQVPTVTNNYYRDLCRQSLELKPPLSLCPAGSCGPYPVHDESGGHSAVQSRGARLL